jgi:L-arabinokinase
MNGDMQIFAPRPDAEEQWASFEATVRAQRVDFFDGTGPVFGARAPGRLDVLGGVADYSGSIVLEMPIAESACAAWQWRSDRTLRFRSLDLDPKGFDRDIEISLDQFVDDRGEIRPMAEVRESFGADPRRQWVRYVAGCFYIMLAAYGKVSQGRADERLGRVGANVLVRSDVPPGAGVSSSAAIEVATMHALSDAAGIHPSDLTLAAWCQRAENNIVGAPCGIMDQVTVAMGREGSLLVLKCQPHDLLGQQRIPPGWRFLGLDSGVKHSVGGSQYTRARVGAFMGLKVIQLESGGKLLDNYLCKLTPAEFDLYRPFIPVSIKGSEYGERYGALPDPVTRADPETIYYPRSCTEHPILENDRAKEFVGLMQIASLRAEELMAPGVESTELEPDPDIMAEAGELMYVSHASYSDRLGLGAEETDALVNEIRSRGPQQGLYGARITGGGAGGTVAVLCEASGRASAALAEVCRAYQARYGRAPRAFVGSSPGALMFGAREIPLRESD